MQDYYEKDEELTRISQLGENLLDTFIRNNKGVLVVASSTYIANLLYQGLLNYTDKVLFFPMDDFLTSEAIAISPEFKVERINTLNVLANEVFIIPFLAYIENTFPFEKLKVCSSLSIPKQLFSFIEIFFIDKISLSPLIF